MEDQTRSFIVYLAGPIDDVSRDVARGWQEYVAEKMPLDVVCFSPAHAYFGAHYGSAGAVIEANRAMINACDVLLANLSGEGRGFGTIREVEFARLLGKPVVVVGDITSLMAHDVLLVDNLDRGIEGVVKAIRVPSFAQYVTDIRQRVIDDLLKRTEE